MSYNPNYFALIQDIGYVENKNTLFQKSYYHDTENDTGVIVLIAKDKSIIIIFNSDNTIDEYSR